MEENRQQIGESNLSQATQRLIDQYQDWYYQKQPKEGVVTIHVDEVASRVAAFYEKIREVVDWKEEHLMRRLAIERILKRRLFLEKDTKATAEPFVLELIRGGHFPNDWIEKSKIEEIQYIIDKYTFILQNSPPPPRDRTKAQLYTRLLGIAACEIEETLDPASYIKANALIEFMETSMRDKIRVGEKALASYGITEKEKDIQIHVAVQRALLNLDAPIISYNFLKRQYPDWLNLPETTLEEITSNIYLIQEGIEKILSHPLGDKFYRTCERYDTPYLLLGDIASDDPQEIQEKIAQPETLEKLIEEAYTKRYNTIRSRVRRWAFYSTLSIFLTNVFALYIIEIPFAKYIIGQFNQTAMLVDVLGPTFLMFLLVVTIGLPKKENLELVKEEIKKNVYGEGKDVYEVELYPKRGFLRVIFSFLYLLSFCLFFGAMTFGLYQLNYPPFSYLIMYIFTSLIAFAGVKIRKRARELDVTEEKETVFNLIVDPFALPLIKLGKWLQARWQKINIVAVFFNYFIEMPFLVFIEFLEQWRYFLKEKKEEIH